VPSIAVMGPLGTGHESIVARPMLHAVLTIVRDAGSGAYDVVELDDGRDPRRAQELLEHCISDEDIIGVVGPKNSGCAVAVRELASSSGVCMMLPAVTADDACGEGTLLRLCASDAATSRAVGRLGTALHFDSLKVEADGSAYGCRLAAAVRAAASLEGLTLTSHLGEGDACFLAMGEIEQANRMRELRADGYDGVLIGAEGGPGGPLARLAGSAAEGSWQLFPGFSGPGVNQVFAAESAAGAIALIAGFEATGDRSSIATWLRRSDRPVIDSPLGPLWFDGQGERAGSAVSLWRVEAGEMVRVTSPALL
jgi:ABC-type branched-subunit amino acid transport system substrate-binding protein